MSSIVERLKELESKATPGPWFCFNDGDTVGKQEIRAHLKNVCRLFGSNSLANEDAYLIAEMRNALPKILAVMQAVEFECQHGIASITLELAMHALDEVPE